MSDFEVESPTESTPRQGARERRAGMFQDPLVRRMAYAALALVILFLATVLGALLTDVGDSSGPRTQAERDILLASAQLKPGAAGEAWAPYITALVANGDLGKARVTLDAARASVGSTASAPGLELAEARLELAQKRYAQASRAADKSMKAFKARQQASEAAASKSDTSAPVQDIEPDYFEAALVRAYGLVGLRQWKDAVAMFDIYIDQNPTAADILVDRGNAKAGMNDKAGAEKDFRAALRFVPYDEEAKAGLKKIGVAR